MIKVENEKALVRDPRTGAILNTDREALVKYRMHRNSIKEQNERILNLESELQQLKLLLNTIINNKE